MSSMKVLNMAGAEVGTVELNDEIFGITPNPVAVHEVVKNHLANCRQGTQSALTRAEVSGGGRKPWRQKGTGHARQGSTRAPQWTHGGIVFAPKPRDYSYVLNKKVKRLALKSVLSAKAAEGKLVVIDSIKMDAIKTADDLKGKVLGVTIGSTGEEAARKIEGANVKVYNTLSDAFLDLKQGAVDAVVNDIPTNEYYVAKTSDHSVKTAPVALTSEDLGIAVKKGNKDLLKKIDDGLAKIKKNGEFAAIYKKWFDREPPAELLK